MDKVIQLPLLLVWWTDIEKWRIRHMVSSVSRPTEDAALDNIYYAARLIKLEQMTRFGTPLSKLEQKIYQLERYIKLLPSPKRDDTPAGRAMWIYEQLEKLIEIKRSKYYRGKKKYKVNPFSGQVSGFRHVLAILDDISYAMRGYTQHEDWLERNWESVALSEVLSESAEKAPVLVAA